ncbi:MAG: rhodanese-like domain-containing protein [bacterium]
MNFLKLNYKYMASIAILSIFMAFLYNYISPKGLSILPQNPIGKDEINKLESNKKNKINVISVEMAKKFFDENNAVFIDSRDPWEFSEGHIFNAINIPEFSFSPYLPIVKSLDKNATYIIYCSSSDCELSRKLASRLKDSGYTKLIVFSGGWEAWLNARFPIFRN